MVHTELPAPAGIAGAPEPGGIEKLIRAKLLERPNPELSIARANQIPHHREKDWRSRVSSSRSLRAEAAPQSHGRRAARACRAPGPFDPRRPGEPQPPTRAGTGAWSCKRESGAGAHFAAAVAVGGVSALKMLFDHLRRAVRLPLTQFDVESPRSIVGRPCRAASRASAYEPAV